MDPDVLANFNCLKTVGDFCTDRHLSLRPFIQALPIPPDASRVQVASLNPPPDPTTHQRYNDFPPEKLYEIHARPFQHQFHPDLSPSTIWGYSDMSPGPLFKEHYGHPIVVRIHNDLPLTGNGGFGKPAITTHLHNMHTASESDGFPGDFYPPGHYHDHHYAMVRAGFASGETDNDDDPRDPGAGDRREALGTLWYHDHCVDFTSQNVYKGLFGEFWAYDQFDSGDENDPDPKAFHLPSGEYDVPLMFTDRVFDNTPAHQLFMDIFNVDGFLGDQYTVNGAVQPYFKVAARKYRFRWLNPGPSRFYQFALSNGQPFIFIANDGNLLPAPITLQTVRITPAERMDVVIDFSQVPLGTQIDLVNIMDQINGTGPTGRMLSLAEGTPVMRFIVDRTAPDPSRVPARMRKTPVIEDDEIVASRTFKFDSTSLGWTINDKQFDFNRVDALVKQGTAEQWTLINAAKDWQHPIHIHLEEHQIISRNGAPPPAFEKGRKDVSVLLPGQTVEIRMRFRDWQGRYPIHCHNTVHEDHAMMGRWDVAP